MGLVRSAMTANADIPVGDGERRHDPLTPTTSGEAMNIPGTLPTLSAGAHLPDEGKACVMEYVSLLAGEQWSDTPACTYYPLAQAAQAVNDRLTDDERHLLVPLIGRLFGTTLPVDDRVFALRVARTVEHLSTSAKETTDVTERFIAGEATIEELKRARGHVSAFTDYAAASAYYASSAAYYVTYADAAAAAAASAATAYAATAADDLVAWLAGVIDIYDELSGRTEHRQVSESELTQLALAVQR
jgi:hypothetical protein